MKRQSLAIRDEGETYGHITLYISFTGLTLSSRLLVVWIFTLFFSQYPQFPLSSLAHLFSPSHTYSTSLPCTPCSLLSPAASFIPPLAMEPLGLTKWPVMDLALFKLRKKDDLPCICTDYCTAVVHFHVLVMGWCCYQSHPLGVNGD